MVSLGKSKAYNFFSVVMGYQTFIQPSIFFAVIIYCFFFSVENPITQAKHAGKFEELDDDDADKKSSDDNN